MDIEALIKLEEACLEFLNSVREGLQGEKGCEIYNQLYKIIDKDVMIANL